MMKQLSPAQRLRQARTKWNIIARREMREGMKRGFIRGDIQNRMMLDALAKAYEAGLRDGAEQNGTRTRLCESHV